MSLKLLTYIMLLTFLPTGTTSLSAKTGQDRVTVVRDSTYHEDEAIYLGEIKESHIWVKKPRQKGRAWRKYYRLVHNFSKVYPYALVARQIVAEADSVMNANDYSKFQRQKYISEVQKELFKVFEDPIRKLTISQGALLIKLIDREVGKSSYNIIRDYKSKIAAGFWQGIAKIFGSDLKKPYDPTGTDKAVEELVIKWENDEFEELYYSIFWKEAPKVSVPSKYK